MSKFGDAFAAARKSGKKEFMFGGERYNTRMRDEESAKPTVKNAAEKPVVRTADKPAATKPAAATPGRVGMANAGPKLDKILGAFSRYSDSAKQGDAAAKKSIAAGQAARMAERAANIAKSKKDYDPSSASSNFDVAKAQMGFKKGGGIERKGKTKGTMVKMAKGGSIDGCAIRGKTRATMVKKAMGGKMKDC